MDHKYVGVRRDHSGAQGGTLELLEVCPIEGEVVVEDDVDEMAEIISRWERASLVLRAIRHALRPSE